MPTITPVRTGVVVAAIYTALLKHATLYGGQLIAKTGFRSGSVYPALEKLCRAGILEQSDDDSVPPIDGRSARREVYRFSEEGRAWALNELSRLGLQIPTDRSGSTEVTRASDESASTSWRRRR